MVHVWHCIANEDLYEGRDTSTAGTLMATKADTGQAGLAAVIAGEGLETV